MNIGLVVSCDPVQHVAVVDLQQENIGSLCRWEAQHYIFDIFAVKPNFDGHVRQSVLQLTIMPKLSGLEYACIDHRLHSTKFVQTIQVTPNS